MGKELVYTHYSYLSGALGSPREPTGLFDLLSAGPETRRQLIHQLITNGELLSTIPVPEIKNMRQLRFELEKIRR